MNHLQATLSPAERPVAAKTTSALSAAGLAKENAALTARLHQVEDAATEALGELQDAQDELDAERDARHAAEQQVRQHSKRRCTGLLALLVLDILGSAVKQRHVNAPCCTNLALLEGLFG